MEKDMAQMTRDRIIWDYLVDKIGNKYGAAALMGNLYAESRLIPGVLEYKFHEKLGFDSEEYTKAVDSGNYTNFTSDKAGYGLAQWTYGKRKEKLLKYANEKNVSIGDINMQLEFLFKELYEDYSSVLGTLKNAKSIQKASDVVLADFEDPLDQSSKVQILRASYGKRFFYRYVSHEQLNEELQLLSKWRDDISLCLMDYPSGQIIYERNADVLRPIGNIVKLLAAYVLMEQVFKDKAKLSEIVTIDRETSLISCNREFPGGEFFKEGENLAAERLLELMLVNSSYAGTLALVKHFFPSTEQFLETMNAMAKKIGINAQFKDFIGISPYNSCNAIDTAKLGVAFLRDYPEIIMYTSLKEVKLKGLNYPNRNKFVREDYHVQGVDRLETGTTLCAGKCCLSTAKRGDRRVISVVLGAMDEEELYEETTGLLEYGLERDK